MKKLKKIAVMPVLTLSLLMSLTNVNATEASPSPSPVASPTPTPTATPTPSPSPSASPSPSPSPTATPDELVSWTDASKIKVSIERQSGEDLTVYDLIITGLEEGKYYMAYIGVGAKHTVNYKANGEPDETNGFVPSYGKYGINMYTQKAGDLYLTIVQYRVNRVGDKIYESKELVSGRRLERPELIKVGTRFQGYFFSDYSSLFIQEPMIASATEADINIKIGTITDKDILNAIKNKESNALSRLMQYAKSADSIYQGKMKSQNGKEQETITNKFEITDGAYYYVYFSTGDGYYPVEDVSLYQGLVGEKIGKNLFDYLSDEFKWELEDDEPTPTPTPTPDDTTIKAKLPQTGQAMTTAVVTGAVVIAGVIFFIKAKKYD